MNKDSKEILIEKVKKTPQTTGGNISGFCGQIRPDHEETIPDGWIKGDTFTEEVRKPFQTVGRTLSGL